MAEISFFDRVATHRTHVPDVLSCIANLSNDEVFTPPDVVNKMLDLLPQELFADPKTTFLDPATKTGVFLREIAKRCLDAQLPGYKERSTEITEKKRLGVPLDEYDTAFEKQLQERIDHIFHNQLFGIGITELTSLLARRSLYCSKYPNGPYSITHFDDAEGNIRFRRTEHVWDTDKPMTFNGKKLGKCIYCGASRAEYDRDSNLESHAYEFIHTDKPEEIFKMQFDVIISNPPYQLSDGGAQASAKPIYHYFVEQAKKLNPRFISMIIPARWYAGGKGLEEFRSAMLEDIHLEELHDFPVTDDCFPGVNIRGGVCYFLWSKDNDNSVSGLNVVTHEKGSSYSITRSLKYGDNDIFIRYGQAISILEKVDPASHGAESIAKYIAPRMPFGLRTDFVDNGSFTTTKTTKNCIKCYGKGKKIVYIQKSQVNSHDEWINEWKVFMPYANNIGTELNDDNQNSFVAEPGSIGTETFLCVAADLHYTKEMCSNLSRYLRTKFARFLLSLAKSSQHSTAKTYVFVPMQDFSKSWTDEELYVKYNLTEEEIEFIESMIKPMDLGGDE